jgi:osmotically-inducible protein OsmY
MKHAIVATLAGAAIGVASPFQAFADFGPLQAFADIAYDRTVPSDAIHSGGATLSDQELADQVAAAIAADPKLDGAIVTVTAAHGTVSLSGSAKDMAQAVRAEQIARAIAGPGAVSGALEPQGG